MILHIIYVLVVFGAGFGVGRIKNAKKLAAATAELNTLKADAAKAVAEVKAKI